MKKIILILFLSGVAYLSFAQTTIKETTQAEKFSSQSGTLIERQFIEIGKVKGLEIKVVKYKDLNSGLGKSALRFEFDYKSSYTSDTKIASLDVDEIQGLITSIKNLQAKVFTTKKEVYTEVTFKSRTGFEAGAYYSTEKGIWSTYVQLEKFDTKSMLFLSIDDFGSLLAFIEEARVKMV